MPDALELLRECSHVRCTAAHDVVSGPWDPEALEYESVFYPLRHHAEDDLTLITSKHGKTGWRVYWGGGDLLHERTVGGSDPPVRPRLIWLPIEAGVVSIDYVCWEGFEDE